jgi:hypothetical protein
MKKEVGKNMIYKCLPREDLGPGVNEVSGYDKKSGNYVLYNTKIICAQGLREKLKKVYRELEQRKNLENWDVLKNESK